ncbi:Gfo/Idh/MocA family oxidoreductase [Clostridium sp. CTA-5]
MRIGIIGIGKICKKAYLPFITSKEDIELVLCTRNTSTLNEISKKYRIKESVTNIDDLIKSNVCGVFIHSSTESHYEICKKLLENKINVYVDKPISYCYEEGVELYNIAKKNNALLMVGFNRRFSPRIKELKELGTANIIIMQKNRFKEPEEKRFFVFDDFIHVIDTIRFLMNGEVDDITVDYKKKGEKVSSVLVKLSNKNTTSIAIMNRENGINEETLEYMTTSKKVVLKELASKKSFEENKTSMEEFGAWETTLYKKGFEGIIDEFLNCIQNNNKPSITIEDALETHKLCEEIVRKIN